MAKFQLADLLRNARLDSMAQAVGAAPALELWSGPMPGACAAQPHASCRLLSNDKLPLAWLQRAEAGIMQKLGSWKAKAFYTGDASFFRIMQGGLCCAQGDVGAFGRPGADEAMLIDNRKGTTHLEAQQEVEVAAFVIEDPNA